MFCRRCHKREKDCICGGVCRNCGRGVRNCVCFERALLRQQQQERPPPRTILGGSSQVQTGLSTPSSTPLIISPVDDRSSSLSSSLLERKEGEKRPLQVKKAPIKCAICDGVLKPKESEEFPCGDCSQTIVIHRWHRLKGELVCDGEGGHTIGEDEDEAFICSSLSSTADRMRAMRLGMSKMATCHGCLGTSGIEREYVLWLDSTREERSRIERGLTGNKHDEGLKLLRIALNKQGEKYGRSAAHCIIPNQMLEWYSPMIVVSFYDIHDIDGCTIELDDAVSALMEVVTARILTEGNLKRGSKEQEAQSFELVMTALCGALDTYQLASKPTWVVGLLGAMRYALGMALRAAPTMRSAITMMKSLALATGYQASPKLWALPHGTSSTPCLTPIITCTAPPKHGGGDPLKKQKSDVQSLEINITAMTGQCRTPVFEVGKQCHDCELEQGDDALLFRYLNGMPLGRTLTAVMCESYGGNPWLMTIDFLKSGIDHFAGKFNQAYARARGGERRQLLPFLQVMRDNWLLFSLYYATCMLEGCIGLSPFRPHERPDPNPLIIVYKKKKD